MKKPCKLYKIKSEDGKTKRFKTNRRIPKTHKEDCLMTLSPTWLKNQWKTLIVLPSWRQWLRVKSISTKKQLNRPFSKKMMKKLLTVINSWKQLNRKFSKELIKKLKQLKSWSKRPSKNSSNCQNKRKRLLKLLRNQARKLKQNQCRMCQKKSKRLKLWKKNQLRRVRINPLIKLKKKWSHHLQ